MEEEADTCSIISDVRNAPLVVPHAPEKEEGAFTQHPSDGDGLVCGHEHCEWQRFRR
jgi:hypothetical protein